jgi:hypothetical protein
MIITYAFIRESKKKRALDVPHMKDMLAGKEPIPSKKRIIDE